jgi:tetratricopeptide (TPR) repeat protein
MLSGQLPAAHGVHSNDAAQVPASVPLVQARLQSAGYATAAFVSAAVLGKATGIDRGFQIFDDEVGATRERRAGAVTRAALAWARSQGNGPFFLWVHLFDPHRPYAPPEPYATRYAESLYDGEVAYVDACLQSLLRELEQRGLSKRMAVIVAGDHGEGLGEHGEATHGALLYEATLRVPLILRLPDSQLAGSVVTANVGLAQVAPTLLELASLPHQGVPEPLWTRAGGLAQADAGTPVVSETLHLKLLLGWSALYSVRVDRYKLIDGPQPELFDLLDDPAEATDLAAVQPRQVERLRSVLHTALAQAARSAAEPAPRTESLARLESLAALGYVGGGSEPPPGIVPVGGVDPRARIALWEVIDEALDRSHRGDQAGAARLFESVAQQDPDNVLALKFLGARALQLEDFMRAVELNARVAATGLHRADALSNLTLAYQRLGRLEEALAAADAAVAEAPDRVPARVNRALVLSELGRRREALEELERVLKREPGEPRAKTLQAELLRASPDGPQARAERFAAAGDLPAALRELDSELKRTPDDPALHDLRGILLVRVGKPREAALAFEHALELDPRRVETIERLGALLHEGGMRQAARARFAQALAIDPSRPGARLSLSILDLEEGHPQAAVERLEAISDGWAGAPHALFYLAEAKRLLGDLEGAIRAYRACLEQARPDDPIREEARQQLASLR